MLNRNILNAVFYPTSEERTLTYPEISVVYDDDARTLRFPCNGNIEGALIEVLLQQTLELRAANADLRSRVAELEATVSELWYAPPGRGGPGYEEGARSFEEHKRKRENQI